MWQGKCGERVVITQGDWLMSAIRRVEQTLSPQIHYWCEIVSVWILDIWGHSRCPRQSGKAPEFCDTYTPMSIIPRAWQVQYFGAFTNDNKYSVITQQDIHKVQSLGQMKRIHVVFELPTVTDLLLLMPLQQLCDSIPTFLCTSFCS